MDKDLIKKYYSQVVAKRALLDKAKRSSWITDCNFSFGPGQKTVDIRSCDKKTIFAIQAKLDTESAAIEAAAKKFGATTTYKHSGATVTEWHEDLSTRYAQINMKEQESELKEMEAALLEMDPSILQAIKLEEIGNKLDKSVS